MITVVVTTRDDERTIAACLSSVVPQMAGTPHEIVVLDDASSDGTVGIVVEQYPGVRLIAEPRRAGWIVMLGKHLPELHGDAVAFLGSHCTAEPDWLRSAAALVDSGLDIASGFGRHGARGFWDRLEELSMHAEYLGREPGIVSILWDDNCIIRRGLLERALPVSDAVLSDGPGATWLSRRLRAMGEALPYRPELRVQHAGASFGEQLAAWYRDMARNAVDLRRADPTMPLASALRWGPLAAVPITAGRWLHGLKGMIRARREIEVGLPEVMLHGVLFTGLMAAYCCGLVRELTTHR